MTARESPCRATVPLAAVRVVDRPSSFGGVYCTKLLTDLGAIAVDHRRDSLAPQDRRLVRHPVADVTRSELSAAVVVPPWAPLGDSQFAAHDSSPTRS